MTTILYWLVPQAQAAVYELDALDVTALTDVGADTAGSIFGIFTDAAPIIVPIVAVFFAIRFIGSFIKGRA